MKLDRIQVGNTKADVLSFDKLEKVNIVNVEGTGLNIGEDLINIGGVFKTTNLESNAIVFAVDKEGNPHIEALSQLAQRDLGIAIEGLPRIVRDGKLDEAFLTNADIRSIVYSAQSRIVAGYTEAGEIFFVGIEGFTLKQVAQVMINLGCKEAINISAEGINGKINHVKLKEEVITKTKEEQTTTTSTKKKKRR